MFNTLYQMVRFCNCSVCYLRSILLYLGFLLFSSASYASSDVASIIVKQKGGNKTVLELSTNPVITFDGEEMVMTNDFTRVIIPLDDIVEYTVHEVASGIKDVSVVPKFQNGRVIFHDIPQGSSIGVYTMDGKPVMTQVADAAACAEISIGSLPNGVYIISVLGNSFKIINKKR